MLVGGFATGLQFAIMATLIKWLSVAPVLSSTVGFLVSSAVNYLLNRTLTFSSSRKHVEAMPRFLVVASGGLAINAAAMWLLVEVWRTSPFVAQIPATLTVLAWNFAMHRAWTFSR
jgi:putative flippase GtrA